MSYTGVIDGAWEVTEKMTNVHPKHKDYPLLPGDIMCKCDDGTYGKFNGLGIEGFQLTPEQEATLKPSGEVRFAIGGFADYMGSCLIDEEEK